MAFGFRSDRARDEEVRRQVDARVEDAVPAGVRIAGAWSWRLLAIAGVIAVLLFLIVQLRLIVIPIIVALFKAIKHHYASVAAGLRVPLDYKPRRMNHTSTRTWIQRVGAVNPNFSIR